MSAELLTTVIGFATILLGIGGGFGWMIRWFDARCDRLEKGLETRLGERIDQVATRLGRVEDEIVEVKIAVARLEGPPRHLLSAR